MRTAFIVGVLLGLAGILAAARFVPWVDPPRWPAHTSVVANGGRAEAFFIHLPADRIFAHGSEAVGLRANVHPASAVGLPDALQTQPLLVEHFKVRDLEGRVIGVAARHWNRRDGAAAAAWVVAIPGRGALLLTAEGEPARAVEAAVDRAGRQPGQAFSGSAAFEAVRGDAGGHVAGGSGEFHALEGRYSETWTVTGVSEAGELKGTIELHTVTQLAG